MSRTPLLFINSECVESFFLRMICVTCVGWASKEINSNMSESLRQLATILASIASTVSPCVTYLTLYIFYCDKIGSVQTQLTQGKKYRHSGS